MKKTKLSYKVVLSCVLTAILFCMPVMGFAMNDNYTVDVHAEDIEDATEETTEQTESTETEESTESGAEESTVSGNDVVEPKCTCDSKCSQYDTDEDCEVCSRDYTKCEYQEPNVKITIKTPSGWQNDNAKVNVTVEDVSDTGNFKIKSVEAKIAQNGSWTDITEDMYIEVSENCSVYVRVTDQKGKTYEKNRYISCFDFTKPTLNAAVSNGVLTIQAHDSDSGISKIYVNGYEFKDIEDGILTIRLEQFDAGYEYFTVQAKDKAGNLSEVYRTSNPYYKSADDDSDENPAEQLPQSAEATKPGSATGTVTEHTVTDSDGNTTSQTSLADQKKAAMAEADAAEAEENADSEQGKEFYTIQTASDKVFYLIIDRDGEEEMVYFLTEVTENDLLNTTSDNSETIPKNSAALESAIPTSDSALPNNNGEQLDTAEENADGCVTDTEETESTEAEPEEAQKEEANPMISYLLMGGLAVLVIGGAYYFKVVRKKKEDFIEDEDEDDEDGDTEEYENEDETEESSDDAFFDGEDDEV